MASSEQSRRAVSFLVRLWVEDRESGSAEGPLADARPRGARLRAGAGGDTEGGRGEGAVVRGFVRNLKTGQESHLAGPERIVQRLVQDLAATGVEEETLDPDLARDLASG